MSLESLVCHGNSLFMSEEVNIRCAMEHQYRKEEPVIII